MCTAVAPARAAQLTVLAIPLGAHDDAVGLSLAPGATPGTQIILEYADGGKQVLALTVHPQTITRRLPQPAGAAKSPKPALAEIKAEDSFVGVSGMNLKVFAPPNLVRYTNSQQDELWKRWDRLPAASSTLAHYEFRSRPDRVEMWINGCYAGTFPAKGGLRQVRVSLPAGAVIEGAVPYRLPAIEDKYCALDIARIAKPGGLRDARVSLAEGLQRVAGVPLLVADGTGNGDVGVVREMKGSWALE